MNLRGQIKIVNRVRYQNKECYGITTAKKDKFLIRLSSTILKLPVKFVETVLHELLHLWVYICCAAFRIEITEDEQHEIIYPITDKALKWMTRKINEKGESNAK